MNNKTSIPRLFNTWHFILLAIVFAEVFTMVANAIQSVIWYGEISSSLLIIGAIDAFAVALIVAPIIFYFMRHTAELKKINEQLHLEIAERKRAEEALQKSENKYRTIFENVRDVFFQADSNGYLTDLSPSISKYTGYTREELIGKPASSFYQHPEDGDKLLETAQKSGEVIDYEIVIKAKDEGLVPFSLNAHFRYDKEGNPTGLTGVLRDITERKQVTSQLNQLNEILTRRAATDPLTGISNRLKFNDTLHTEIFRTTRFNAPLSLIMFDIDDFKKINDRYGHHIGDSVLTELTSLVSKHVRIHDLFARWGGEEFMIMATNTAVDNAQLYAEKLRLMIESHVFPAVHRVTCSFGVAQLSANEQYDQFTQKVDNALYRAKTQGRNRVEVA